MDKADDIKSIEDLINTLKDPQQRKQATELMNKVFEAYKEKADLKASIEDLEKDIKRLKAEKERMEGADNN